MNKKLNTLFFVLGATLFNVIVTLLVFVLLMVIFLVFLIDILPEAAMSWVGLLSIIASIAASFMAYRFVLNRLLNKIKFEDYFDPIFKGYRPPPKKRND